jgi:hypothetical protein
MISATTGFIRVMAIIVNTIRKLSFISVFCICLSMSDFTLSIFALSSVLTPSIFSVSSALTPSIFSISSALTPSIFAVSPALTPSIRVLSSDFNELILCCIADVLSSKTFLFMNSSLIALRSSSFVVFHLISVICDIT